MFNAHWLTYFDDSCTRFMESLGLRARASGSIEFDVMLVKAELEWKGSARFDEWIDIAVAPVRLGTKSFDLRYTATVDGRAACDGDDHLRRGATRRNHLDRDPRPSPRGPARRCMADERPCNVCDRHGEPRRVRRRRMSRPGRVRRLRRSRCRRRVDRGPCASTRVAGRAPCRRSASRSRRARGTPRPTRRAARRTPGPAACTPCATSPGQPEIGRQRRRRSGSCRAASTRAPAPR